MEGGQRWCELLVIRLIVLWSWGSSIIIIDVNMLRHSPSLKVLGKVFTQRGRGGDCMEKVCSKNYCFPKNKVGRF